MSSRNYRNYKIPYESQEHLKLSTWMDYQRIFYVHIPNELIRGEKQAKKYTQLGVKAGAPDFLIFDTMEQDCNGIALELKRIKGGRVSPKQKEFLQKLEQNNWLTLICKGADEAIQKLKDLGLGKKKNKSISAKTS